MVKINFLDKNKKLKVIEANIGSNLLEVSKKNNIKKNSRLACQIKVTERLNGLIFSIA